MSGTKGRKLPTSADVSDYEALAARVEALLDARQADCENIQRHIAENQRLRDAFRDSLNLLAEERDEALAENKRLRKEMEELEAALDQYREDADEWKCPTCGEWMREWEMYCPKCPLPDHPDHCLCDGCVCRRTGERKERNQCGS